MTRDDLEAGGGDIPERAREAAYRAYRGWRIGDDGEGRLHAALVAAAPLIRAAERERAEAAEAKLAEVRETIAAFFTHHGNSAAFALRSARDLAEGVRQVLDRAPLEAPEAAAEATP